MEHMYGLCLCDKADPGVAVLGSLLDGFPSLCLSLCVFCSDLCILTLELLISDSDNCRGFRERKLI